MKRAVFSVVLAASVALVAGNRAVLGAEVDAQDFLILKQTVEAQQQALERQSLRIAALESQHSEARREIETLRRANNAQPKDLVTQEQLKALAAKLEQVDTNRRKDSERLVEAMKKIVDTPPVVAPPIPHHSPPERPSSRPAGDASDGSGSRPEGKRPGIDPKADKPARPGIDLKADKPTKPAIELPAESYQYVVKPNETLSEILVAYRKEYGLKTTMAHLEQANPKLNPKKLHVGQTILIPIVK